MVLFDMFKKDEGNRIKFTECLSYPFMQILSKFKDFFVLTTIVSLVVSLITFLCGRGFLCGMQVGSFCSATVYSSVLSAICSLCGAAFFINRWELITNKNQKVLEALKEKCFGKDLKAMGVILLYFIFWGIVGFCGYMLKQRAPLSNWKLELGVFVLFSMVIIFCLLMLLNFVMFYHYLQGGKFFTLNKIFGKTCDALYALMSVFLVYMLIFMFVIFRGEEFIIKFLQYGLMIEYLSEFYLFFMFCTILAVFVCSFDYQENKLFDLE